MVASALFTAATTVKTVGAQNIDEFICFGVLSTMNVVFTIGYVQLFYAEETEQLIERMAQRIMAQY